ncbi:MAG: glycosyltransferase [Flavobacteriales bacterium]|nr:glycosyltransferase [Flavobacteriales bacterium]
MFNGARILVAPLDWGLGHSTRCIPVIERLMALGAVPVIGADNGPLKLLIREFPDLEHVRIPGAEVRYAAGTDQRWAMLRQFPRMVDSVRKERALLERIRPGLKLDAVISDQRFGIRSPDLPSILITHQVFPFSPLAQGLLRKVGRHLIARFDRCWVMDLPEAPGLAGELSHGASMPSNCTYVGTQSRMSSKDPDVLTGTDKNYRVVVVISGPEPQRTLFEARVTAQLGNLSGRHLVVRGVPGEHSSERSGNIDLVPHLCSGELALHMTAAELIVSRSGYTTLMDLNALERSALVVPTPGQAEQEYLGRLHALTGRFLVQTQEELDISRALNSIGALPRPYHDHQPELLERALKELSEMLH